MRIVAVFVGLICLVAPANALLSDLPLLSAPYHGWSQQVVGETSTTPFGMAVDAQGRVHFATLRTNFGIAYIRPDLAWVQEDVFQGGVQPDLAVDALGNPHIVYGIFGTTRTGYATRTDTGWSTVTIDSSNGGGDSRIRVDSLGRTHVIYDGDSGAAGLWYALNNGGVWSKEMIASGNTIGMGLDVDSAGRAHVAYTSSPTTLRYATNSDGAWTHVTLPATGAFPDLAIDTADNPHIAFQAEGRMLGYARLDAGVWSSEIVDPASPIGADASIDTDSENRPHIVYRDLYDSDNALGGKARYATRDADGSWKLDVPARLGNSGYNPELRVDEDDFPRIGYNLFKTQGVKVFINKLMLAEPIARTIVPYGVLP